LTIEYFYDIEQNTDPWQKIRRGVITASNISKILTPAKLQISKSTGYLYTFCRQTIDEMPFGDFSTRATDRGHIEETLALQVYEAKRGGLKRCGFIENTDYGFKIGCSPDALCNDDGGVQVKSFTPNVQFGNIIDEEIEAPHLLQTQMELLVSGRSWWDFIHQSSGTHQIVTRILPDKDMHSKILEACENFYSRVKDALDAYRLKISDETRFFPTQYVAGLYDQPDEEITI
jgi:hypothetical protein